MAVVLNNVKTCKPTFYPKTSACNICGIQFKYQACHLKHMRQYHSDTVPNGDLHCSKCKKVFKVAQHKQAHMRHHSDATDLKCVNCHCKFINIQDYVQHIIKLHTKGTRCPKCCVMLPSKLHLKKHLLTLQCQPFQSEIEKYGKNPLNIKEKSKDKFQCEKCDKQFSKIQHLKAHIDHVHTGMQRSNMSELFSCEFCDKKCTSKSQLISHLRIHTGSKPFQCPHCNSGFALKGNLNVHISRWHTEESNRKYKHPLVKKWKQGKEFSMFQLNKPIPHSPKDSNNSVFVKFKQKETGQRKDSPNSVPTILLKGSPTGENVNEIIPKVPPLKPVLEATAVDPYILLNIPETSQISFDEEGQSLMESIPELPLNSNDSTDSSNNSHLIQLNIPNGISTSGNQIEKTSFVEPVKILNNLTLKGYQVDRNSSEKINVGACNCKAEISNPNDFFENINNEIPNGTNEHQECINNHDAVTNPPLLPFNPGVNPNSSTGSVENDDHSLDSEHDSLRKFLLEKDLDENNWNFTIFPLDPTISSLSSINFNELYTDIANKNNFIETDWDTGVSKSDSENVLHYANYGVLEYAQCEKLYSEEELLNVQKRYLNNTSSVIACREENSQPCSSHAQNITARQKNDVTANQQKVIVFNNNSQSKPSVKYKSNVIVKNRNRGEDDIDFYRSDSEETNLADTWLNELHTPSKTARSVYSQGTVLKNISDGEITDIMTSLM